MDGSASMQEFERLTEQWQVDKSLQVKPCSVFLGVNRQVFFLLATAHTEKDFNQVVEDIRLIYKDHGEGS